MTLARTLFASLLLLLFALPQGTAFACPPGTVFSARDGNGLCLKRGEGLKIVERCATINKNANECPAGWAFKSKASDRKNNYCCPTQRTMAVPDCDTQCAPLLTAVKPEREGKRVNHNCIVMCIGNPNGTLKCADGSLKRFGNGKNHC